MLHEIEKLVAQGEADREPQDGLPPADLSLLVEHLANHPELSVAGVFSPYNAKVASLQPIDFFVAPHGPIEPTPDALNALLRRVLRGLPIKVEQFDESSIVQENNSLLEIHPQLEEGSVLVPGITFRDEVALTTEEKITKRKPQVQKSPALKLLGVTRYMQEFRDRSVISRVRTGVDTSIFIYPDVRYARFLVECVTSLEEYACTDESANRTLDLRRIIRWHISPRHAEMLRRGEALPAYSEYLRELGVSLD